MYTRALRAQLNERPEAFASEMPCAPAAHWLAHSVRAGRAGAHDRILPWYGYWYTSGAFKQAPHGVKLRAKPNGYKIEDPTDNVF